jgi:hypothetical protein
MNGLRFGRAYLPYIVLIAVVTLTWCATYNRWSRSAWKTPIVYGGDAVVEMAMAKALATGEIWPILPKHPAGLGAPYAANWNDFPTIEEPIFAWQGLLARLFGLFAGSNLTVLSAHLLAAVSFYAVCRLLRYNPIWSSAGGILFGLTPYAFSRYLPHINLTFYWHIPWGLLVAWWCASAAVLTRRMIVISIIVALVHGTHSVYYSNMFLQFLAGAALISLFRRQGWRRIVFPIALGTIVVMTVLLMNVDTFYERIVSGPNPLAIVRNYSGLEIYALRPIEMLLPATHRLSALQEWAGRAYYSQTMLPGEMGSPYLGIICILTAGCLVLTACRNILRGKAEIMWHGLGIAWICLYSIVGGINGVIGAFGLHLFRCTNRFSIVILALLLLWGVRQLSRISWPWPLPAKLGLAALATLLGVWDQTPPSVSASRVRAIRAKTEDDRTFARTLESRLAPRAMVFELPVMAFPEAPPINQMQDYEHLRPYLYSHSLRFSYGSEKGREREEWQSEILQLGIPMFVRSLEQYGFSAVLINKKAYTDNGAALIRGLSEADRSTVLAESADLVSLALNPRPRPVLPPYFDANWYSVEGDVNGHWRWSRGDANILLFNNGSEAKTVSVKFGLSSVQPRRVEVYAASKLICSADLTADRPSAPDVTASVLLPPGQTSLHFHTDVPGAVPGNGDGRALAFALINFDTFEQQ